MLLRGLPRVRAHLGYSFHIIPWSKQIALVLPVGRAHITYERIRKWPAEWGLATWSPNRKIEGTCLGRWCCAIGKANRRARISLAFGPRESVSSTAHRARHRTACELHLAVPESFWPRAHLLWPPLAQCRSVQRESTRRRPSRIYQRWCRRRTRALPSGIALR